MTEAILGLTAGFMLVLGLLLVILIKAPLHWGVKLLMVLVASGFYWVQYHALLQYAGWPTDDHLPDEFVLIATDIREPDPSRGDEGAMFWWVRESDDPDTPPRVYRLPYRAQLHESGEQVVEEQKQGQQYVGRSTTSSGGRGGYGVEFERILKSERYQKN